MEHLWEEAVEVGRDHALVRDSLEWRAARPEGPARGDATAVPLRFRNVDADPSDPVSTWPFEAIVTAIDCGYLADWRRLISYARLNPSSEFAEALGDALAIAEDREAAEYIRACLRDS